MGALHFAPPPHPLGGTALFLRAPLRPLCPHPHVCALRDTARERSPFFRVAKPLTPGRPSAAGCSGLKLGRQVGGSGRARGRDNGPGTPPGRGPPAGPGHSRGHSGARGASPRRRGPRGSQAQERDGQCSTTTAGPTPPHVRAAPPPPPAWRSPRDPPPQAGSRGSCRPGDLRPRDPYFKRGLRSRFQRPPPPPRAHNGLCALCSHLGLVCPRSPRGPPLPARSPLHVRPPCFALGCPRRTPEPSGAHTQGGFLSFLFPNESGCGNAGNGIKIARRTPKWSFAAA